MGHEFTLAEVDEAMRVLVDDPRPEHKHDITLGDWMLVRSTLEAEQSQPSSVELRQSEPTTPTF